MSRGGNTISERVGALEQQMAKMEAQITAFADAARRAEAQAETRAREESQQISEINAKLDDLVKRLEPITAFQNRSVGAIWLLSGLFMVVTGAVSVLSTVWHWFTDK